jgi:hypothetical protein
MGGCLDLSHPSAREKKTGPSMSTSPAASPIALNNPPQAPNLSDPALHKLQDDSGYCPVDIGPKGLVIARRYQSLKSHIQQAVLSLWERAHENAATILANCGRHGSVYAHCKKNNAARAHRHTCHLWIDDYCGKPVNLLRCWLRWRGLEVRTERQYGIELRGPLGSNLLGTASRLARWLKDRGMPTVIRLGVTPKPRYEFVRIVVRADQSPFREVVLHLHKITKNVPGYCAVSYYESSPVRVLEWMFASTESVLQACGHTRARLYLEHFKQRMTRTYGSFYAKVEDETLEPEFGELRELGSDVISLRCDCGECDGIMQFIPYDQRHTAPVECIVDDYKGMVDWTSCKDPFFVRRSGHKRAQTYGVIDGTRTRTAQESAISRAGPS